MNKPTPAFVTRQSVPVVYGAEQAKTCFLNDLRRQIEMRERMLCRPGLEHDERIEIGREYQEYRNLEDAL